MTGGKAALVTLAVVVVVAAYLGLTMAWLGLKDYWVGFVFLTQWGVMEQCKAERLPASIGGAVAGTAIALTPSQLPLLLGATPGLVVALAILLVTIFVTIGGWVPMVFNGAAMIFLTVISIPEIVQGTTPAGLFLGLAAGVICFGGLGIAMIPAMKPNVPEAAVPAGAPV